MCVFTAFPNLILTGAPFLFFPFVPHSDETHFLFALLVRSHSFDTFSTVLGLMWTICLYWRSGDIACMLCHSLSSEIDNKTKKRNATSMNKLKCVANFCSFLVLVLVLVCYSIQQFFSKKKMQLHGNRLMQYNYWINYNISKMAMNYVDQKTRMREHAIR